MTRPLFTVSGLPALFGLIAFLAAPAALRAAEQASPESESSPQRREPLSPEASAALIEVLPGLRVELAASEPQVVDPVAAVFDHHGRLWVVEMPDYPTGPVDGKPHDGRIKILTDEDGDGFFETVVVFADGLVFPTGVQPFLDGVIVTMAGQVAYLADTTGDGRCDTREVWFTGFKEDNEQLRANHPTWTVENEVHVAGGLRGGEVRSKHDRWPAAEQPLSLATRDFRFAPFGGDYRAVAGNSQFGFFQDDGGRNFVCSNRNPCRLILAEADQVAGNPLLPLTQWIVDVMPAAENSSVFPLIDAWTTSNLHAGQFTAACGVYRYQSDLLADLLADDYFACEPTGSLVQRYRQMRDGIVPETQRGREGLEFLASRDPWFRAVDLFDGPDGSMYVIDMHRAVIEHPQFMPKELKERGDMRWGDQAGRIYRIVRETPRPDQPRQPEPAALSADHPRQLVTALASANRWQRTHAGRLLAELGLGHRLDARQQGDLGTLVGLLEPVVSADQPGHAVTRALWLLEDFDRLQPDHLTTAASHADPAVRRQAVRLLARNRERLAESDELLHRLADDADAQVRYQWLLEVAPAADRFAGSGDDEAAGVVVEATETQQLLQSLIVAASPRAGDAANDRLWIGRALSLVHESLAAETLARLLNSDATVAADTAAPLVKRLGWAGSPEALRALLSRSEEDEAVDSLLDEFAEGMAVRNHTWAAVSKDLDPSLQQQLSKRLERDRGKVEQEGLPIEARAAALRRVGLDRSEETKALCRRIVENRSDALYLEALPVLRHFASDDTAELLIGRVTELPPRAASTTISAMVNQAKWTPKLLDALESEEIPWGLVDPSTLGRLQRHSDREIAARVKELLAGRQSEDKEELLKRYTAALDGKPDAKAGKALFVKQCAGCHRIGEDGVAVGPDISDQRTQTPEQILVAILDPNAAIDANYYRYAVLTDDGQVLEGLLEDAGSESITLRMQDDIRRTIPRDQIEQLRATGVSMMPEGFENQLTPEQMRDLIGYVKRWRFLDDTIPLTE